MFFLRRLEPRYRGIAAKRFLKPIRSKGLTNPGQIVNHVRDQVRQRAEHGDRDAENLLSCLACYPDEALHCAAYYVEHEHEWQLKTEARRRRIVINPPTPSQLAYLRALGYHEKPLNESDANDKIVRLMIGLEEAPEALITLRRNNGIVVGNVASWDIKSRELARSLGGGHWQFEVDSDTTFLIEQPKQRHYSSLLNSDSIQKLLKKLKWVWILLWWLIFFHA